jgi:hypothetical protein
MELSGQIHAVSAWSPRALKPVEQETECAQNWSAPGWKEKIAATADSRIPVVIHVYKNYIKPTVF